MSDCSKTDPTLKTSKKSSNYEKRYQQRYYAKNKTKLNRARRWRRIKEKYGLTTQAFYELLESQGGCCHVCKSHDPGNKYGWHIDHDHSTNKIRSILCHSCNTALGHAKECPDRLRALADYIEGSTDE